MTVPKFQFTSFGSVARPIHLRIRVEIDPETGGKMSCGERNNLSQDQIRVSPGEGNTYSLYLRHTVPVRLLRIENLTSLHSLSAHFLFLRKN
eukprot:COSAG01_NODE_45_length_32100_cov_28.037218_26_plen_92_part_00